MDPKDLEIEARLQKLRSEIAKPITSDEQLVARLAGLKGSSSNQPAPTDEELAQRLSYVKGVKHTPSEDELESRLAQLKGDPTSSTMSIPNTSNVVSSIEVLFTT